MDILVLGIGALVGVGVLAVGLMSSMVSIRPSERGLIERFGQYNRFAEPGLQWVMPFIEKAIVVDITEGMVNAEREEVITKDSLNAVVEAQIYFKVKQDEASVKKSQYAVADYEYQIVQLTKTTLRAIIGTMSLTEANSNRNKINKTLRSELESQVGDWGIDIVRAEIQEITPPADVQAVMNKVVAAEKTKIAAKDLAAAVNIEAEGQKQASIREAEGVKQTEILKAEGQATAIRAVANAEADRIKLVSESSKKHFTSHAITMRKLEVAEKVMAGTKMIVSPGVNLMQIMGEAAGVPLIINGKKDDTKE